MQPVIVTITSAQRDADGEEDRIELVSVGRRYEQKGVPYITYEENLSGMEGATTLLKIYPDHLTLVRLGAYQQKLEFFPGQKTWSAYITPYGSMKLAVLTKELSVSNHIVETVVLGHTINVSYELEIDGQWQSSNTLSITIRRFATEREEE